jgi:hypothetical protein
LCRLESRDPDPLPPPSRRGSYPSKSSPRQQPYRITAAFAFLPFTPPEGVAPPVTPVSERPGQRRLKARSTPRPFSTDESVATHRRCRQCLARSFHGLCSPPRSALVRSAHSCEWGSYTLPRRLVGAWPPRCDESPPGLAAKSLLVFPALALLPPKKQLAKIGVTRSLSGPARLRRLAPALTSMGFLTSKIAPRSEPSVSARTVSYTHLRAHET